MKVSLGTVGAWTLVVALGVGAYAWWQRPATVDTTQATSRPLVRTLQFTARVATPARVELGTTLTGRVARVRVDEGDVVRAGAPLIELETDEARAATGQAEAALRQADATLRAADRDLPRTQELVAQSFYSQQKLDDALRARDVARAQREASRAALEAARAKLGQHVVRAPADGVVLVRSVDPGQIVQAGKALLTVSVLGPMELVAQVDERFLGQLQVGQSAQVVADAFPRRPFQAQVSRLAPSVNAQSGSVEVRLGVQGPRPDFLREDMTLSVEVRTGERQGARVLPLRALRTSSTDGEGADGEVMVLRQGRAVVVPVKLGLRTLTEVEVLSGLGDQDIVVLEPAALAPDARVQARASR
jgi:HlyD family secretion protein